MEKRDSFLPIVPGYSASYHESHSGKSSVKTHPKARPERNKCICAYHAGFFLLLLCDYATKDRPMKELPTYESFSQKTRSMIDSRTS